MIPKMNAWILYMHLIDRFLAEIGTFLFQGVAVVSLSLHSPPLWIRVSFMNLLLLYLYSTVYHSIIFFNCQLIQLSFHSAESFRCFLADNAMPVLSLFTVCRLYINICLWSLHVSSPRSLPMHILSVLQQKYNCQTYRLLRLIYLPCRIHLRSHLKYHRCVLFASFRYW